MIELTAVTFTTTEGRRLLDDVSLRIDAGRTAVIGANGSGKTTFARLLNGLAAPTTGSVTVDGRDTVRDRADVQRRVGFVFQNAEHQLVAPTPLEDVALGLRARGVRRGDATDTAGRVLDGLGLGDVADQAVHTLSGGEQHLVALAGVLALSPDWIVLDEPTTSLDVVNRRRVLTALDALDQRLIVVTHDLDLARGMDQAILVDEGRVRAPGAPDATVDTYLRLVADR